MFTYLHVSDVKSAVSPSPRATSATSPASTASSAHSSSVLVRNITSDRRTVCNHKASSQKQPIRREGEQRRRSTLGIAGSESTFRQRCNTWPEGERKGKESRSLQVFVKKSMVDFAIKDQANDLTFPRRNAPSAFKIESSGPLKNICSYLSLGSTLSFCLPKRFQSSISELEPAVIYNNRCDLNNPLPSAQSPADMSASHQAMEIDTEQAKVHPSSSCKDLDDTQKPCAEVQTQELDHTYDHAEPVTKQDDVQSAQSKHKPALNNSNESSGQHQTCSTIQCSPSNLLSSGHRCLSVHTKIKDLNGHLYYSSKYIKINSADVPQVWSNGLEESGKRARIINCGVRDCAVCFSDTNKDTVDVGELCAGMSDGIEGVLQPGHWLFQQEEEELEDIWRGKMGDLASNCTLERNVDDETGKYGLH